MYLPISTILCYTINNLRWQFHEMPKTLWNPLCTSCYNNTYREGTSGQSFVRRTISFSAKMWRHITGQTTIHHIGMWQMDKNVHVSYRNFVPTWERNTGCNSAILTIKMVEGGGGGGRTGTPKQWHHCPHTGQVWQHLEQKKIHLDKWRLRWSIYIQTSGDSGEVFLGHNSRAVLRFCRHMLITSKIAWLWSRSC